MLAGGMIQYIKDLSVALNLYAEQLEDGNYVPYWIELWDYTDADNDRTSILWLNIPELSANTNTSIYIVSTYPKISESNGKLVFEIFDDFSYNFV